MCGSTPHAHTHRAILWHQLRCPTIQVNSDIIWRQHHIPKGKDSVPQDCPPFQISSLSCSPCFWATGYKSEVPITPSLGSMNLLERLTELNKAVYSLDYRFITGDIKRYESTARWRDIQGEVPNKGASVPEELGVTHRDTLMRSGSPTWKPSQPRPFGFLQRLHHLGTTD